MIQLSRENTGFTLKNKNSPRISLACVRPPGTSCALASGWNVAALCTAPYEEALRALEKVRGRVESEALEHHASQPVHPATPEESELTRLNIALINTDNPAARASITNAIYTSELQMQINPSTLTQETIAIVSALVCCTDHHSTAGHFTAP